MTQDRFQAFLIVCGLCYLVSLFITHRMEDAQQRAQQEIESQKLLDLSVECLAGSIIVWKDNEFYCTMPDGQQWIQQ